jgi:hypothetical protein
MRPLPALLVAALVALCVPVSPQPAAPVEPPIEIQVDPWHAGWHLPALRATTRAFLHSPEKGALARAEEALLSGDIPLAAALLAAVQRHKPLDEEDPVAEAIRLAAIESLARHDLPWGAQPFLTLAANPSLDMSSRALANTLLDQLEPDDVKGNAYTSCELYLVGLSMDWDTWFGVLMDRVTQHVKGSADQYPKYDQTQTLLSSLALLAAIHGREGLENAFQSWWFMAYGRQHGDLSGFRQASDSQKRALIGLAHGWHDGSGYHEGEYEFHAARGNRHMAWWLLEGGLPHSAAALRTIALDDETWYWRHRRRAVAVFLVMDPELLLRSGCLEILPEVIASYPGHWDWPVARLGEFFRGPIPEGGSADCYVPSLQDIVEYEPVWERAAMVSSTVAPYRETFLQQVRNQLARESDPQRQLNLAAFLKAANDPLATELIGTTIVSNLVDDEVFGNRERARWLMEERGTQDNDAMHAGLRLGLEMRDWQLTTDAAEALLLNGEVNLLDQHPGLGLFLLDQMKDDATEGNAAAAVRVLRHHPRPAVERLFAQRPPADEHEAHHREWALREE